uniref:Uncharacterized protein n=1 Tax=Timema poppense TaxID=170557 RepID=A0A7R9CKV1_TIMPO|nr:unnamed protein product [Timema poppensis]
MSTGDDEQNSANSTVLSVVCVGIQVPPDENEDWYCRVCIINKQELMSHKKKKSRKRKQDLKMP